MVPHCALSDAKAQRQSMDGLPLLQAAFECTPRRPAVFLLSARTSANYEPPCFRALRLDGGRSDPGQRALSVKICAWGRQGSL